VGSKAASGTTTIIELGITVPNLSGYAIFENDKLVRAVFINLNAWLRRDEGVRGRDVYHIDFTPNSTEDATGRDSRMKPISVKRLNIGYASDTKNLTWGGQDWETTEFLASGKEVVETKSLNEGVDIRETEAVLVWFW
jgi:hypothetical protein